MAAARGLTGRARVFDHPVGQQESNVRARFPSRDELAGWCTGAHEAARLDGQIQRAGCKTLPHCYNVNAVNCQARQPIFSEKWGYSVDAPGMLSHVSSPGLWCRPIRPPRRKQDWARPRLKKRRTNVGIWIPARINRALRAAAEWAPDPDIGTERVRRGVVLCTLIVICAAVLEARALGRLVHGRRAIVVLGLALAIPVGALFQSSYLPFQSMTTDGAGHRWVHTRPIQYSQRE